MTSHFAQPWLHPGLNRYTRSFFTRHPARFVLETFQRLTRVAACRKIVFLTSCGKFRHRNNYERSFGVLSALWCFVVTERLTRGPLVRGRIVTISANCGSERSVSRHPRQAHSGAPTRHGYVAGRPGARRRPGSQLCRAYRKGRRQSHLRIADQARTWYALRHCRADYGFAAGARTFRGLI